MDLNSVTLSGRLTRDSEAKELAGKGLIAFSIAVNTSKDSVMYIDVSYWTSTAEIANKLSGIMKKGMAVGFTGYLKQDNWQDKQTGAKRSKIVAHCNAVQFFGKPADGSDKPEATPAPANTTEEDVPF